MPALEAAVGDLSSSTSARKRIHRDCGGCGSVQELSSKSVGKSPSLGLPQRENGRRRYRQVAEQWQGSKQCSRWGLCALTARCLLVLPSGTGLCSDTKQTNPWKSTPSRPQNSNKKEQYPNTSPHTPLPLGFASTRSPCYPLGGCSLGRLLLSMVAGGFLLCIDSKGLLSFLLTCKI